MDCCSCAACGWMPFGRSAARRCSRTVPVTARRSAARSSTGCSHVPGAVASAVEPGCCSANPAPAGSGGGPHHPQKPGRLRRHQQPAGALLPLQCRQARHGLNRFPRDPGELPSTAGWLHLLRAGGRRKVAAGKRFSSCAGQTPWQSRIKGRANERW